MFVNRRQSCLVSSQALNYCTRGPLLTNNTLSQSLSPSCGAHLYCDRFYSRYSDLNSNYNLKKDVFIGIGCLKWSIYLSHHVQEIQ